MSTASPTETATDNDNNDMKIPISPTRSRELIENLHQIQSRIKSALQSSSSSSSPHLKRTPSNPPRLIAVSKLKPASDILALHQPEPKSQSESPSTPQSQSSFIQTHFGENYVQELLEKSRLLPRTIRWHFIGGLQSNKCTQLAREIPNLWAVESVDSIKKANLLNKGRSECSFPLSSSEGNENENENEDEEKRLRIFVQINTSGESSKSGVDPKSPALLELCQTIRSDETCPHLKLQGLMTIGAIARSKETTADNVNEDFDCLRENRDWLVENLKQEEGLEGHGLELSMGMSEDFEGAIVQGSDEVRVGSTIFGARPPKKEAKVLEQAEDEKD